MDYPESTIASAGDATETVPVQNAKAGQTGHVDGSCYLLPKSIEIYEGNENSVETTGALAEPVQNEVQCNPVVAQHHGLHVRCLQFEDAQQKVITNKHAQNPSGIENSSRPLASSADRGGPKSLSLETPSTPISRVGMTQHTDYPGNRGNYSIKVPTPLGIGLHLNSIVSTMQVGAGETIIVKSSEKGIISIRNEQQDYSRRNNDHASVAANSAISVATYDVKPLDSPMVCNTIEDQSTPVNKRRSNTGNADDAEEFNKSSPKRKRKKTSESNDDYSCKLCNCKKSKCLKLQKLVVLMDVDAKDVKMSMAKKENMA